MAFKKSKLFSTIWESCNKLRGGMDSSQYKDYILTLLFVKYVSDKKDDPHSIIEVPAGADFSDLSTLKGTDDIGNQINIALASLAKANDLTHVIDAVDFNDDTKLGMGRDKIERLSGLVALFENPQLDFRKNRAANDDILGDAYEYLMKNFATESGKSKGQFYTPTEVSIILARLIGAQRAKKGQTLYDPTCGSGSLLLRCHSEARHSCGVELAIHGQEMDVSTYGLSKINMVIHGCADALIEQGNTLSTPKFTRKSTVTSLDGILKPVEALQQFDYIVANPPFSQKAWMTGFDPKNDTYHRFELGVPPDKNGDYAFLLHIATSLNDTGKAAVVLPHGVLFRGNAEGVIRANVINKKWIKAVVGLPANLFFGTGIPACIIVLDKEGAERRQGIFMVDASKGFMKDGNKNKLRARDMQKIIDTYEEQNKVEHYSRMVPFQEIVDNDNNLNIPRYVSSGEIEDVQNLKGHLSGGIPAADIDSMAALWTECPILKNELFEVVRPGYFKVKPAADQIKAALLGNSEFQALGAKIKQAFNHWETQTKQTMESLKVGDSPKNLVTDAGLNLLTLFKHLPLLDPYDVYQHLMSLWEESMQDDVFAITSAGWMACKEITELPEKTKEEFNLLVGKKKYQSDIIPPELVIQRFYAAEKADLTRAESELEQAGQTLVDILEEHGAEGGSLEDYTDDGKWVKGYLPKMAKALAGKDLEAEEREVITLVVQTQQNMGALSQEVKEKTELLGQWVLAKIQDLTETEIKALLVEDKWLGQLERDIQTELERVNQTFSGRIKELSERYAEDLPSLVSHRDQLAIRVAEHMKLMGF